MFHRAVDFRIDGPFHFFSFFFLQLIYYLLLSNDSSMWKVFVRIVYHLDCCVGDTCNSSRIFFNRIKLNDHKNKYRFWFKKKKRNDFSPKAGLFLYEFISQVIINNLFQDPLYSMLFIVIPMNPTYNMKTRVKREGFPDATRR